MSRRRKPADVCLLLEGTYPYIAGGVSTWVHDLIGAQSHLRFHLLTLLPSRGKWEPRYELPDNVVGQDVVYLQNIPTGDRYIRGGRKLLRDLRPVLEGFQEGCGSENLVSAMRLLGPQRHRLGAELLMDSELAWQLLQEMYEADMPQSSFLDYFWSWRSIVGGWLAVMLCDLPPAWCYHTVSTGYAGLLAARAVIETGRPAFVTEHGIYTNERRIEISVADWLEETGEETLNIDKPRRDLKDLWINVFVSYSRCCYEMCDHIITLYGGNQVMQRRDGAPEEKLRVIPNGIDFERFSALKRDETERPPMVALIGRVVPIKDVKTYIRAIEALKRSVPDVQAVVMGPTDEDEEYFAECEEMIAHLKLGETLTFTGRVNLNDWLGRVDVIVLSSLSEAQPLVILEAGAAGIPTVATDVGACREMIEGMADEEPALGPGGAVVPVANPLAVAEELGKLLRDPDWYVRCSLAIKERVRRSYNKTDLNRTYGELYRELIELPDNDVLSRLAPGAPGRAA